MAEPPALLDVQHVAKRYTTPGGDPGPMVLCDVDLRVRPGESVAIVGVSGSGKSTLLNILGALDRPTSGTVRLEGRDLADLDERALAEVRNRRLGFVFQLHHLLPQCTALENVLVPTLVPHADAPPRNGEGAAVGGGAAAEAEARARALLLRVGLEGRLDYRPARLSGGQRQRVAVARALVNRPRLLLADEPTGSLDRETSDRLADLLVDLNRQDGLAMVVVTHSAALAHRMGRRLELRDGRLHPMDA
jgi:predicted ABC-type transport system involved in lysophospholipase L1 biosynthesis ATPase subunit